MTLSGNISRPSTANSEPGEDVFHSSPTSVGSGTSENIFDDAVESGLARPSRPVTPTRRMPGREDHVVTPMTAGSCFAETDRCKTPPGQIMHQNTHTDAITPPVTPRGTLNEPISPKQRSKSDVGFNRMQTPRSVRVAADFNASPVWNTDAGVNMPVEALPLSPALAERLHDWAGQHQQLAETYLDGEQPDAEQPDAAWDALDRDGFAVARDLQKELKGAATVSYENCPMESQSTPVSPLLKRVGK